MSASEVARLTAENEGLRAVLRQVEWAGYVLGYGPVCCFCRGRKDDGHTSGCALAAALKNRLDSDAVTVIS